MNKMICALMATAIIGSFAVETTIPVSAAIVHPLQLKGDMKTDNAVEDVQYNRNVRRRPSHGGNYHRRAVHGNYNRNYYRRPGNVRGGGYWHGHRGYRDYRPGYRYYNGWWYPAAAFVGGAIVGGAIANQPTYVQPSYGSAHVQWCYNRYRSYRASDNTFQPNSGPRRQCVSPY